MQTARLATPRGTRDVLPPASERIRSLTGRFAETAQRAGFRQVITPIFEHAEVFRRVGESTDIVSKEMYEFRDKDQRLMALRPELTAPLARAFANHRPRTPWRVWYEGPQFRYEKPQAGRYRQFNQVGAELIGSDDPQADAEMLALAWRFCEALGLRQVILLINSLGSPADRAAFSSALGSYFARRLGDLSEQGRATLAVNPLRLLDSKRPEDRLAAAAAPDIAEFLSKEAAGHFQTVLDALGRLGIPFAIEPRLVRGLDYYRHTTFELRSLALDGAQDAVGGGGRYDGLVADLGGPPTPGVGFAMGVDRLLLACDAEDAFDVQEQDLDIFVVDVIGGVEATLLADEIRQAGISAERAFDKRSMKAQMKAADRSGARFALLIGAEELASGTVTLRDMRRDDGEAPRGAQVRIPRGAVCEEILRRLAVEARTPA